MTLVSTKHHTSIKSVSHYLSFIERVGGWFRGIPFPSRLRNGSAGISRGVKEEPECSWSEISSFEREWASEACKETFTEIMETLRLRLVPPSYSLSRRSCGVRLVRTVKIFAPSSRANCALCKHFAGSSASVISSSRKVAGRRLALQAGTGENVTSYMSLAAG